MGNQNGTPVLRQEDIESLQASSQLTEEQIRDAFNNFMKEHPNGKINKAAFAQMMGKAMPDKDAKKMDKHIFRVYDTNNDGVIDFTEFMVVFHMVSEGSPEDILTKLFRVFDVNGDGCITKTELKKLIKDMYGLLKSDDDASKATEEMIATYCMNEMDTNGDGKIKLEEYIKACLDKDEFSKRLTLKIIDIFISEEESPQ